MGKKKEERGTVAGGSGTSKHLKFDPRRKKDKKMGLQKQDQEHILKDARFSKIATDPRFRGIPAEERKLRIDDRFKSMFTDKRFDQKHTVDKRGRPVNFATSDNLKKYYQLDEADTKKDQQEDGAAGKSDRGDDRFQLKSGDLPGSDDDDSSSEEDEDDPSRDLARGKGNMESSSDDSDADSADDDHLDTEEQIEHPWAEFSHDAVATEEVTRRLALVNMDWDGIKAEDIFSLLNSFKPTSGVIKSVTIYPSDYGLERLREEDRKGPLELRSNPRADEDASEEEEDESQDGKSRAKGNEKLREYQLNRLKYYYAVIECDSCETAGKIYDECDGLEYENSSTALDLRFISDDMEFEQEAKSVATSLPANYVPSEFVSSALQQSKVKCSWDETARDRKGLPVTTDWAKQDDLQAYLASSSEEEDEEEDFVDNDDLDGRSVRSTRSVKDPESIDRYRALILGLDGGDKRKHGDGSSESDGDTDKEEDWEPDLKSSTALAVEKKQEASKLGNLTPFEKILEKQAANRKARKNAKQHEGTPDFESALADEGDDDLVDSGDEDDDEPVEEPVEETSHDDTGVAAADLELLVGEVGGKRHFNLTNLMSDAGKLSKTKLKKKRKLAKTAPVEYQDDFTMNLSDPRFAALYTSSQYNVDMSDPSFKKTKAMDALITEKLKRRAVTIDGAGTSSAAGKIRETPKMRPEISSLAKSVKAKIASEKLKATK